MSTEEKPKKRMVRVIFEKFKTHKITDTMLEESARLFSENYGIWGKDPTNSNLTPGSRVRLNKNRLRAQCLPDDAASFCSYARVIVDDQLAGNAFACRWDHRDRTVCWITQLVVHRDFRMRGLATGLLNHIREDNDSIYGIMSSHPAACLAAAKAYGHCIESVSLGFIREHAAEIMASSPIGYIKNAELCGSLFDSKNDTTGAVSSVDTKFFVDHAEPLEALSRTKNWPLGALLEGKEFLFLVDKSIK